MKCTTCLAAGLRISDCQEIRAPFWRAVNCHEAGAREFDRRMCGNDSIEAMELRRFTDLLVTMHAEYCRDRSLQQEEATNERRALNRIASNEGHGMSGSLPPANITVDGELEQQWRSYMSSDEKRSFAPIA